MTLANPIKATPIQKQRKTYFPFEGLLRSVEFQGKGACKADNCYIDDGRLRKTKGLSLLKDTLQDSIVWMGGYKKSDGTYQLLYAHPSGANYKVKALGLDDLSIVTPSGGAGDVLFTSNNFSITQIGDVGHLTNESATTGSYTWNGTTLTALTSTPASPRFVVRDGNRISVNKEFSMEVPATSFTGGTGVLLNGDYAMSIEPVGAVEAGAGIIVFGNMGAEAHKVIPNNASDEVSAKTKIEGFSYTGLGIKNTHQVIAGKNFVYFINSEGIQEMNPYNGQTRRLTDMGNIKRRFLSFNLDDAVIGYNSKMDQVCVMVKSGGQNDTMILVDTSREDRAISIQPGMYFNALVSINNELYGAGGQEGKIFKCFDTYTSTNLHGSTVSFRWILEWDAITNPMLEKRLYQFAIFANLNPLSSFTAKLYKDGSHEAIKTQVFTTTDASSSGIERSNISALGKYVFNLGSLVASSGLDSNSDKMEKTRKNAKIATYCLEIIESSQYDFKVYDIFLEWSTKGQLIQSQSLPNTLF